MILSPFIESERLKKIFGSDMLNDESFSSTFDKLIGLVPEKPFECVGTVEEANTAIGMTIQRCEEDNLELPKLLQYYKSKGLYHPFSKASDNPYLQYYNEENQVPKEFVQRIKALMLEN
jgi:hypothetical protein